MWKESMYSLFWAAVVLLSNNVYGKPSAEFTNISRAPNERSNTTIPERYLNITQLISKCGYSAEVHYVETEDGYILTVLRIPREGPTLILYHGLLNSADDWFTQGPDSLGCLLANAGYDVWLGNARGNKYSRKHITLSPNEPAFWNFTFHEMGYYDLPATIDYALHITNRSQLTYVGHSQGTLIFFIMMSERPEYNKKVTFMVSLATIAWLSHAKSPVLRALVAFRYQEAFLGSVLGLYEILPYNGIFKFITGELCSSSRLAEFLCASGLFTAYGFDYGQLNYTQLGVQYGHIPAGASLKHLLHYAQLVASGEFQQFDYKGRNIEMYGTTFPPKYSVENITAPVAIFYGRNDWISSFEDVQIFIKKASNIVDVIEVQNLWFNHMDFLWAKDVKQLVYTRLMKLVEERAKII